MIQLSEQILKELNKRNKHIIPVVEFYPRKVQDIASLRAPDDAFGRFAFGCYTWTNSTGSYTYDAKVLGFPEVQSFLGKEVNRAEVTFGNAKRGEGSMTRFVLDNKIKGAWMVIRLIFPDAPDESLIVFWGKADRPGEINNSTLTISAKQDLGNYKQEIPFRTYQVNCPLEFAKPYGGCLGDETLAEKSVAYREAVAKYGSAGCNKQYTTCTLLNNTRYFQGQRVVAVSGQFSYITVEEIVKRVLFWTKRKKIQTVKTDSWSSVNQSEDTEDIPIAFGRCQIQGHPITWADVGNQVRSIQGFCEGRISAFNFIRSRTEGINVVSVVEHLGDWGGVGTQQRDLLFNGVSGYNSRLAYLELTTDGSSPTQVDDAPIVTAVIKGLELPVPDANGNYTLSDWSNNPVHITRFLLTDTRFGRIPFERMDDPENLITASDCDELIEDHTNHESIVLPANEAENYNRGYRRYRSVSRYTAYRDMYEQEYNNGPPVVQPEFEDPEIRWFNPFEPYTIPPPQTVLRTKYTCNGAIQEKTSILDFLYERIFPTFKGYLNYGVNGKIQIRNRRKADNTFIRQDTRYRDIKIPVTNILPWRRTRDGFVVIGVSFPEAEVRKVTSFEHSTACNGTPVVVEATGSVTATSSGTLAGGSSSNPGLGWIDIGGTVTANSRVEVKINSGDDEFKVSYTADGVEDLACFTRMLTAFLNANVAFHSFLTAYILPSNPTRINIRCESGYLVLDKPLQYKHFEGEEVLRVQAVFENCGSLEANESAQYDNIIDDSFRWNVDAEEEVNAIEAKYISAVDDFHLTKILPRAAWDTIDLEGELNKEELDLTFVDNYWQAAYLAKGEAIDRIDGNLNFEFSSNIHAVRLELGDVVAVRHDSGDGALNYVPVWVTAQKLNLDNFTTNISAKLYLSAAFDYHVSAVDTLLTTTLNSADQPEVLPEVIGTNGGVGHSTQVEPMTKTDFYGQFATIGRYSPTGKDIV